jgi:SPP1 gp7 family putative phage head morphogenesis protein
MKDKLSAAVLLVPDVIPHLTIRARLLTGAAIKATRDRRTWQGQAEKELQNKISGLMKEYWKLTGQNIAAGENPNTDEFAKKLQALLQNELANIAADGAEERAASLGIAFDPAAVDIAAEAWAREYSYDLIKGIDATTRETVANAITAFTNTPGMTNADIIDKLSGTFGEVRAQMIAVTEVTRAFAASEQIYQTMLDDAGIATVREWLTSEDETVCPICGALNGKTAELGEVFVDDDGNTYDNPPAHVNCRCGVQVRLK